MSIYRNSLTNLSANLQMIFGEPSNEAIVLRGDILEGDIRSPVCPVARSQAL
jgi:hypothetical protein